MDHLACAVTAECTWEERSRLIDLGCSPNVARQLVSVGHVGGKTLTLQEVQLPGAVPLSPSLTQGQVRFPLG